MRNHKPVDADEASDERIPQFFKSIRMATPGSPEDVENRGALPPKDSWIALDPGTEFELNAKTQEEWLSKVQRFRRVRGNFLAACFDLEYTIDAIIGEVFFPKPRCESSEKLKTVFDESFLKTRAFGKKIALLEKLRKELPALSILVRGELTIDLKDLVHMRNGFAHFPIIFKPEMTDGDQTLVPQLALKYPPLTLDKSFFEKYSTLIPKVSSALSEALQMISQDKTGTAAAGGGSEEYQSRNKGPVYVGHAILNTDIEDWMLE